MSRDSRSLRPHAIAACLLLSLGGIALAGCADEELPSLEQVDFVFLEDQSWESGGGTARLTIWADGRSEIRVYAGPAHLYPNSLLRPLPGWRKLDAPSATTFIHPSPFSPTEAVQKLTAAVKAGISLLESEDPQYLDGGGVLVGVQVNGALHQAVIPTYNERLRQRVRFDAVARALGEFPKEAFDVVRIR